MTISPPFKRFATYSGIGVLTFAFDLLLLSVFTEVFIIQYLVATALAFLLAVSVNYVLSRKFAFKGTKRTPLMGYIYFTQFAIIGMAITTLLMWVLTIYTGLHYLFIRVVIAGLVGMMQFLLNLYVNFKVGGKH